MALGTGWYAGRLLFNAKERGPYGKNPELLLQMEMGFRDGTAKILASDAQWEGTFVGPVVFIVL